MSVMSYSLGHGLVCLVYLYELHREALAAAALRLHWHDIVVMLYEVMLRLCNRYVVVMLWLPCQPGENKGVCSS